MGKTRGSRYGVGRQIQTAVSLAALPLDSISLDSISLDSLSLVSSRRVVRIFKYYFEFYVKGKSTVVKRRMSLNLGIHDKLSCQAMEKKLVELRKVDLMQCVPFLQKSKLMYRLKKYSLLQGQFFPSRCWLSCGDKE